MSKEERSHLLHPQRKQEQARYVERSLHQLPYQRDSEEPVSVLPPHLASPSTTIHPHNPAINIRPPTGDNADLLQSQVSVASYGGHSILGGEAGPKDIQELLDNLDKATKLIRRHLQENGDGGRVPVPLPLIPRWVTSYLLLITFIWQTLNIAFLELVYRIETDNTTKQDLNVTSNVVMTAFQGVHLILVFFVSFKLVKKVLHRSASGSLLAQCYLSTVLLFAGLYTLEFRFRSRGFQFVFLDGSQNMPTLLFLRMLYFSVSTATLCGTSEVEPLEWYASLTVSVQMLMSFVYFASILSLGVLPQKESREKKTTNKSITQRFRDFITNKQ